MLLLAAMNSAFVLENPFSSYMFEYGRVKQLIRCLRRAGVKAGMLPGMKGHPLLLFFAVNATPCHR